MSVTLEQVEEALREKGLVPRGAFHPEDGDGVPLLAEGGAAGTVVLAGNAGPEMWKAFSDHRPAGPDPLDGWSHTVLEGLAREFGAEALYPAGKPPYLPFQRWAMRAEPVYSSPIGILIHPDYGLWHGYRGALAFAARLDLPAPDTRPSPCESCEDKPCLTSCPVDAFSEDEDYDTPTCIAHIATPKGADCMNQGCRARRVCPIGRDYIYAPEQAAFHMDAFVKAHRRGRV